MRRLVSAIALAAALLIFAAPAQGVTKQTARFVASFEGFYSCVYEDPAGHATIGYGHLLHYGPPTKRDRKKWGCLTKAQAQRLLRKDLRKYEAEMLSRIQGARVSPGMITALTSFAFNLGAGALDRQRHLGSRKVTNIARQVRIGNYRRAGRQMLLYDGAIINGKRVELLGLKIRRRKEFRLMVRNLGPAGRCGKACSPVGGGSGSNGGTGAETGGGSNGGSGGGLTIG
ncbi:MAG: lysozyme [Actinomycetota bacterium]|nr:lysozyme [Actinomycetota bacterium]